MGDFRVWWALFVFFGVLSVLAVQRGYRRWRRAQAALAAEAGAGPRERALVRREGIRLACMAASVIAMTALVFAALLRAPAGVLLLLRAVAVVTVSGVIWLSLRRSVR